MENYSWKGFKMKHDVMLEKLKNCRLYKLAIKGRIRQNDIPVLYKSKNFMVVEDDFFSTLLKGYEILNKAHQNQIQI